MLLQRYPNGLFSNPLSFVENMRRQFEWTFGADPLASTFTERTLAVGPRFETRKTETGIELSAELPGMKAEDLQVKVEDRTLTISGQRASNVPEGYEPLRQERLGLRFTRAFSLGDQFDPESIHAELKDGMLTLTLNKRPEAQPKVIDVKVS